MTTQPPVLACMPRSPEQLIATINRLDPERNYLPADLDGNPETIETRCNWFAADACLELGAELPGQNKNKRVLARHQILWLRGLEGRKSGWRAATEAEAVVAANKGQPVLTCWLNPNLTASSHIALGAPSADPSDGMLWIAQAGRQCFNRARATAGFGFRAREHYIHD